MREVEAHLMPMVFDWGRVRSGEDIDNNNSNDSSDHRWFVPLMQCSQLKTFKKPKAVNLEKRYATKEEIPMLMEMMREREGKEEEEVEEEGVKENGKGEEEEEDDDDDSDSDYDFEEELAKQNEREDGEDEDGDEDEHENESESDLGGELLILSSTAQPQP